MLWKCSGNSSMFQYQLCIIIVAVYCMDISQCQDGAGFRFPNLFNFNNPFSLSNLFRPQRPNRPHETFVREQPPPPPPHPPILSRPPLDGQQQLSPHTIPTPTPFFHSQTPIQTSLQPNGNPFVQQPIQQFAAPFQQVAVSNIQQPGQPTHFPAAPSFPTAVAAAPSFPTAVAAAPALLTSAAAVAAPTSLTAAFAAVPIPAVSNPLLNNPQQDLIFDAGFLPLETRPVTGPIQQQKPVINNPATSSFNPTLQQLTNGPVRGPRPNLQPAQFALSSTVPKTSTHQPPISSLNSLSPIQPITKDIQLDCGSGNDVGFCPMSDRYPRHAVNDMMHRCHDQVRVMFAEIPEDYESLGDNHLVQISKNGTKIKDQLPWSWSIYSKESACDSELRFIQPGLAQDRQGHWQIIVQTPEFPQRVLIDVCRNVEGVCKVLTDCGRKSRCVQRYSYYPLIALDQNNLVQCPTMKIFRFPTSCLCHVEVDNKILAKADHSFANVTKLVTSL